MAQFPMTDNRRKILQRIPEYAVVAMPTEQTITVLHEGRRLAKSKRALLIKETRHQDVFYLPIEDVDMTFFERSDHTTYCPFKGHANYYSLSIEPTISNVIWTYETPYPEVAVLKGYVAFYTDKVVQTVR